MEYRTTEFEFSHGHKPRGNGLWGFELHGTAYRRDTETGPFWVAASYAAAKRQAIAKARELDAIAVEVLP